PRPDLDSYDIPATSVRSRATTAVEFYRTDPGRRDERPRGGPSTTEGRSRGPQSLYGSWTSRPAIATPSGRSRCFTRIVPPCAASTSGRRLYTSGSSPAPPPTSTMPCSRRRACTAGQSTRPGRTCSVTDVFITPASGCTGQGSPSVIRSQSRFRQTNRFRRLTRPAACERLITRPAPCTVEKSASSFSGDSTPSRITDSSPIEPPTKPSWPGRAGVHPLRTTQYVRPPCSSCHAKLWWLCTSCSARAPRISSTLSTTTSRPAYAYSPASSIAETYDSPSSEPVSTNHGGESISPSCALPSKGRPCASARKPDAVLWPKPREPKWTPTHKRSSSSAIRFT